MLPPNSSNLHIIRSALVQTCSQVSLPVHKIFPNYLNAFNQDRPYSIPYENT